MGCFLPPGAHLDCFWPPGVIWAVSMAFVIGVVDLIWCLASGSTVRMLVEMGLVCLLYVPVMISGLRNLDELE